VRVDETGLNVEATINAILDSREINKW